MPRGPARWSPRARRCSSARESGRDHAPSRRPTSRVPPALHRSTRTPRHRASLPTLPAARRGLERDPDLVGRQSCSARKNGGEHAAGRWKGLVGVERENGVEVEWLTEGRPRRALAEAHRLACRRSRADQRTEDKMEEGSAHASWGGCRMNPASRPGRSAAATARRRLPRDTIPAMRNACLAGLSSRRSNDSRTGRRDAF